GSTAPSRTAASPPEMCFRSPSSQSADPLIHTEYSPTAPSTRSTARQILPTSNNQLSADASAKLLKRKTHASHPTLLMQNKLTCPIHRTVSSCDEWETTPTSTLARGAPFIAQSHRAMSGRPRLLRRLSGVPHSSHSLIVQ